jgi:type III secretory pathway component EscS
LQFSIRETTLASRTLPILLSLASDAVWIAAAWLLVKIMRAVTKAQEETAARQNKTHAQIGGEHGD